MFAVHLSLQGLHSWSTHADDPTVSIPLGRCSELGFRMSNLIQAGWCLTLVDQLDNVRQDPLRSGHDIISGPGDRTKEAGV